MKYLIRSIKYYIYLVLVLVVVVTILYLLKFIQGNIEDFFVNGYNSLWQMALIITVFAGVYPRFGYGKRVVHVSGPHEKSLPKVEEYMNAKGYIKHSDDGEVIKFRKASFLARLASTFEDTVTFGRTAAGYEIEGRTKEIVRIDTGLTKLFEESGE